MDENRDLYFRLNFFILEAMYKKLAKKINIEHGSSLNIRNIDNFYIYVMCSNRSDYSKYRRKDDGKKKITSTMEKYLLERCKWLKPYLGDDAKLITTGDISTGWAKKIEGQTSKDIVKECEEQVDSLCRNIVTGIHGDYSQCIDDADYICCWMYHFIMDMWVEATEAEAKIERIISALESVSFDEIDRCSNSALDDYYGRLNKEYQLFKKVYDYKKAKENSNRKIKKKA